MKDVNEITNALRNIKEVGNFYAKRTILADKLQIAIKPLGTLKFPFTPEMVQELIKVANTAKFGRRDQTLLDPKVLQDAWEISKDQIKIEIASWDQELNAVLELLKKDLGLPDNVTLQPNLHNLLIYEPGQFFNYHQDSEKLDDRIATLVIILPSKHKGTLNMNKELSIDNLPQLHEFLKAINDNITIAENILQVDSHIKHTSKTRKLLNFMLDSLSNATLEMSNIKEFIDSCTYIPTDLISITQKEILLSCQKLYQQIHAKTAKVFEWNVKLREKLNEEGYLIPEEPNVNSVEMPDDTKISKEDLLTSYDQTRNTLKEIHMELLLLDYEQMINAAGLALEVKEGNTLYIETPHEMNILIDYGSLKLEILEPTHYINMPLFSLTTGDATPILQNSAIGAVLCGIFLKRCWN